ncbi:SDR family oxidoreductase [Streptomyces chromofuscus]|uniref:NAD(P)H-binding protein n=1 Tax=Streptomyces chromofuscus TaxID=42881 RepID=A0A7M2TAR3_STRCW|nr:NAD(P)H-binding protein [Streptomyces chromofuscus]QOV44818.1 NAD(P)H-binding protein [Streptomyces chromofuscus]GGS99986.1 3-beta hydroxysteroid dehydrogenase [Streptomyces chromofuscus]
MRVAIAGATGNIGALTVAALERGGHDVVRISRSLGVDLTTGDGLDAALDGVEAVVDATSYTGTDRDAAVAYFGTATRNLLAAEHRAGVRHHVLLSIVGVDRVVGNAHYAGKREQERLVTEGPVPWTIVRATQFHDFAATVTAWTEQDGVATIPPLLVQPIAPEDVADVLAEIATGAPQGRYRDVAGPDPQDLVDMARRTNEARGRTVKLVPTWSSVLGPETAGEVMLPGEGARIAPTTFDTWLATQRRHPE